MVITPRETQLSAEKPPETETKAEKGQTKAGDNVRQNAISEQSQNTEFEVASKAGQDFTSMSQLQCPSVSDIQQHAQQSSFGIIGDDGDEVASSKIKIAQRPEELFKLGGDDLNQSIPRNLPTIDSEVVIEAARELIKDRHRWKGPMCNVFVDATMRKAGVPLPWKENENHSCEAMVDKLSKDPRFELVWQRDSNDLKGSKETWKFFQVHDGDIAIWKNKHLVHSGIMESAADNRKNIYYAGASNETGANYADADYFVESKRPGYGPPDYIFRYRGFEKK